MSGTEQVVLKVERYNKLRDTLDQLELSEAKGRMALEEAGLHIEQLHDILHAIKDFSGEYAPFNSAMAKIQKMAEEGLR